MAKEDKWVRTFCEMCLDNCGILVHRENGVVTKIEGNPDFPNSQGKICSKGHAAIMSLYDPNRLKTPLKRTNPEKGIGVDPGWEPISWEEALNILQQRLRKVREEDPRKLVMSTFEVSTLWHIAPYWSLAFGSPNFYWVGYFCGQYLHSSMFLTNGTFHCNVDLDNCNYLILLGNQMGFGAGLNPNISMQKTAVARKRGMKVVCVDPVGSNAASKADEWIPIRPGTDAVLILTLINLLLNHFGLYDGEFIRRYTNGPYLVKPDGYYMKKDNKPLVWDAKEGRAKAHDAEVKDYALEGNYSVEGVECKPAFQLLKEHVKTYNPEMAAEVTTIPAATIRRLAEEFGKEARIGSTITIDGMVFPYRPVAVNIYRGAGAHVHGTYVALAVQILNQIVGAFYVPGGHRGLNLVGPSWNWAPSEVDGLIKSPGAISHGAEYYDFEVKAPETTGLNELFPISTNRSPMNIATSLDPEKYKLPYKPEVLLICRRNLFKGGINHEITAKALKKYNFIAFFGTHLDEVAEFADLALPEAHSLEKFELFPHVPIWSLSPQAGYWYWGIRQPVVPPSGEAREWIAVLLELADRVGFRGELYKLFNVAYELKEPYRLDPSQKYTLEEIYDRRLKSQFGDEKGLEWFKENAYLSFKRTVDELYPLPWLKVRFPIYFENFKRAGERVREVTQNLGLDWWDTSAYTALAEWKPCSAYSEPDGFDFYAVNFRVPTHSQSWTEQNPWLNEVATLNPYARKILINTKAAGKVGIRDKDKVCVESEVGRVKGEAKLTECIHPECVGISSHFGSWAKGKPVAREEGRDFNFNNLLPFDEKRIEWLSSQVDSCVRVKVYKE